MPHIVSGVRDDHKVFQILSHWLKLKFGHRRDLTQDDGCKMLLELVAYEYYIP